MYFKGTCPFLVLGSSGIIILLDTFAVSNPCAKENVCFCAGNSRRLYVISLELPNKVLELLY